MMKSVIKLMDLQAQDRVVAWKDLGYGKCAECMSYVECVDYATGLIHILSTSGHSSTLRFEAVLDVQKAAAPIVVVASDKWWSGDPAWLGKPVRAVAASISRGCRFSGLVLPKWPGGRPGIVLHVPVSAYVIGMSEAQILSSLPSYGFNPIRAGDPERARNRTQRTAHGRITKWIAATCRSSVGGIPIDPSLKQRAGLLINSGS